MGDNPFLGDRDGVRTPMQWSADRNAGFSGADYVDLYLPPIAAPVLRVRTRKCRRAAQDAVVTAELDALDRSGAAIASRVCARRALPSSPLPTKRCWPIYALSGRNSPLHR